MLHQVLLKQERVVSSHGAGMVVKLLVVVANVRLPLRREKFIHIHLITERHHDHNACKGKETDIAAAQRANNHCRGERAGKNHPAPRGRGRVSSFQSSAESGRKHTRPDGAVWCSCHTADGLEQSELFAVTAVL